MGGRPRSAPGTCAPILLRHAGLPPPHFHRAAAPRRAPALAADRPRSGRPRSDRLRARGRTGARLAAALSLTGGAWAILARVRAAAEPEPPTPRVLGVDDWSLRRGQHFATMLLDLERHAVIDLLPDREAATFAAWPRAHPGVALISRDRGGAYAEGARQGAPAAIPTANRFHIVRNLMDALERACTRHHAALRTAVEVTHPRPAPEAEPRQRRYSELPHNQPGPTTTERRAPSAGRVGWRAASR